MKNFEEALKKYAEYVIKKAKENLAKGGKYGSQDKTGALSNSLSYNINKGKVSFLAENYGVFQDQGVKGAKSTYPESRTSPFKYTNKMPPSSVFDKWSIRSGIAPRDKKGRFIKRKSLNFLIARSIYKKGIRATMFFTKPFEEALPLFEDEILEGFLEDNLNLEE
tara:strand:+ start:177 stop:671 length:495 start_codon:yes stop_codon:yes gene_type:complete